MNRRGFTLFEVMVALVIVGMVTASAMQVIASGMAAAEQSQRVMESEALMSSRLEAIGLMTDDDFQSVPDSMAAGVFDYPMEDYSWTMQVYPDDRYEGLYQVQVTVSGRDYVYKTSTYAYRRPPVVTVQ